MDRIEWLDRCAKAQLTNYDYEQFVKLKDELISESDEYIEEILTGNIWNCLDSYSQEEFTVED